MTSKKYDPFINFAGLERLQEELGRMFNVDFEAATDDVTTSATSSWRPAADIVENDRYFEIRIDLPGVDPDRISVELTRGVLTVEGARAEKGVLVEKDETLQYKRRERKFGDFHRRFTLPETADEESVSASNDLGVLVIKVAKKSVNPSRRIHIVTN